MGFFTKFFGSKSTTYKSPKQLVEQILRGILEKANLNVSFKTTETTEGELVLLKIELFGKEEDKFTEKDGALLEAIQLFLKRVVQHQFAKVPVNVEVDCKGFREETNRSLVELAKKLTDRALDQGRSVYLRALPPKDRKVVHQFLAEDGRVKSRSIGDGLYKKIKIYPVKGEGRSLDSDGPVH